MNPAFGSLCGIAHKVTSAFVLFLDSHAINKHER